MYSGLAASHWRRVQGGRPVARARSLSQFQASFPDETSCAAFLFERCWPEGFVCPACCNGRAASLKSRAHTYECLGCGRQTSITAGTVMHRSKLPLTVWFWAAPLMATHSNGMSALQFEAQLGITYKTAWLLAQKLRRSMIDPQREPLEGVVGSTKLKFRSAPTTGDLGTLAEQPSRPREEIATKLAAQWTRHWREMDLNHRSLSRGSRFILRKVNCAGIDGRPKKFGGVPMSTPGNAPSSISVT